MHNNSMYTVDVCQDWYEASKGVDTVQVHITYGDIIIHTRTYMYLYVHVHCIFHCYIQVRRGLFLVLNSMCK